MGVRDNFVYSKKDVMVAGVAAAIVVVMFGLGFGLTTGASLPGIAEQLWGFLPRSFDFFLPLDWKLETSSFSLSIMLLMFLSQLFARNLL